MAQPINLNKARKAKARATAKKTADANAVKFGRTKAEKASDRAETRRIDQHLDQSKRDDR